MKMQIDRIITKLQHNWNWISPHHAENEEYGTKSNT